MKLAPPPLEIGDRDGFESTDMFGHEESGTDLPALETLLEGPSLIARDGEWGSGRTICASP